MVYAPLVDLFRPVAERNVATYCAPTEHFFSVFVEDASQSYAREVETVWADNPNDSEELLALGRQAVAQRYFDID